MSSPPFASIPLSRYSTVDTIKYQMYGFLNPQIEVDWFFIDGVPCDCESCSDSHRTWRYFVRRINSKKTKAQCPHCNSTEPYCCWELDDFTIKYTDIPDALEFFKTHKDYEVVLADFEDHHVITRYFE